MYKIITINGKILYSLERPEIVCEYENQIKYSLYTLDEVPFYVEKCNEFSNTVYMNFSYFDSSILNYSENSEFFTLTQYEKNNLQALSKQPLMIFQFPEFLKKHDLLLKILDQYPQMILTLLKKDYNDFLSIKDKMKILTENNIFPKRYLDKHLLDELLQNEEYMFNYIYHFIKNELKIIYSYSHDQSLQLLFDITQDKLKDMTFVEKLLTKERQIQDCEYLIDDLNRYFDIENEIQDYMFQYQKHLQTTKYNQLKYQLHYIDIEIKKINSSILNYDVLSDLILKKAEISYRIDFNANFEKIICDQLTNFDFNNFDLLIAFAKKGICLSPYSELYQSNIELIYLELKNNPDFINDIPKTVLSDRNAVLKLRSVYPNILSIADKSLLNNEYFMIEYLKLYSCLDHFFIDGRLLKNKEFMNVASQIDPYIEQYKVFSNENEFDNESI